MDDPWANAWGEPTKPAIDSQTLWPTTPVSNGQDSEADIGTPSWATGPGVQWAEPSEDQTTLWHPLLPGKEWNVSPYDTISLGQTSSDELSRPDLSPTPAHIEATASSPSSPTSPQQVLEPTKPDSDGIEHHSRSSTPSFSITQDPGSPDAFGMFETGLDADETDVDPWLQSSQSVVLPASHEIDTWVPSWGVSDPEIEVETAGKRIDEWEAAKHQKESQDRHVVRLYFSPPLYYLTMI